MVAGIRTPSPINEDTKNDSNKHLKSLQKEWPKVYKQLAGIRDKIEKHYRDMQDIEFTIEEGTLYMLQTRTGKRTGMAAVRMAVDMADSKLINKETAIMRVKPEQLDELLHPMIDPAAEKAATPIAKGLPAGPGGGVGQAVFTSEAANEWAAKGLKVILVRNETSPEDVEGMRSAVAILTAMGGMTSHAALVARGWGKCCIVGCGAVRIDAKAKQFTVGDTVIKEGDWISLNGSTGKVYKGKLPVLPADPDKNKWYSTLMKWADGVRQINVRTNAESPADAEQAVKFGAEGIGLARTEHMFFEASRIIHVREMIWPSEADRRKAVMKAAAPSRRRLLGIFKAMAGKPVPSPARPAAARVRRQPARSPRARSAVQRPDPVAKIKTASVPARAQPDARPPRLPPRHRLSRDHRDAGPRHHQRRRQTDQGEGQGHARNHGPARGHQGGTANQARSSTASPPKSRKNTRSRSSTWSAP